tara:strand:- start:447 stop:632 length:186 start_codon:yes stop_codon:yes gene_type:complete
MALNLDLLSMGNYGIYVWFAYSAAAIILFSLLYISIRKWRQIRAQGEILETELTHKIGKAE